VCERERERKRERERERGKKQRESQALFYNSKDLFCKYDPIKCTVGIECGNLYMCPLGGQQDLHVYLVI